MSPSPAAVVSGLALTLSVHAGLIAGLLLVEPPPRAEVHAGSLAASSKWVGYGLCGKLRCQSPERKRRRREPEPDPYEPLDILEAALMPALGMAAPDPKALPKLQTYEQPEIIEDGVNLDRDNRPPDKKRKKAFDAKDAKRDRKEDLSDILSDFEDDDPRKRATHLSKIVGHEEGVIGGTADAKRAGSMYAVKVARAVRKRFVAPSYISGDKLQTLRTVVLVTKLSPDGEILAFRIKTKSGEAGFDDAALAAVQEFAPSEGGTRTLPRPDAGVLRYVNEKGMKLDLDGKHFLR